jgi:CDP-glycerol glycerophosphotransferase (TagB/SpsB family)
MNLPRWDKYNKIDSNQTKNIKINNNSIFVMFTWRKIKKRKDISSYYLKNISNLVTNVNLGKEMNKNNVTLYLSFHRLINKEYKKIYQNLIKKINYIKLIHQNEISECLSKTSLIITDFSSIVFDIIYRRKPFIIYIPDSNDPEIKHIYTRDYYELIESMKNGSIYFENKYFNINKTINKIIYYINNNFTIEPYLERFYDSFGFKNGNNINIFIDYLKNLS